MATATAALPLDLEGELYEHFVPGCAEPDFGVEFLRDFAKQSARLTDEAWARYRLDSDVRLNGSNYGQRFRGKYFDAAFNFCLVHDGALVASLGFEIDERSMIVWQIQGVRGQGEHLGPIKWAQALLRYAVRWAREAELDRVYVASVDNNRWAAEHAHLDRNRGKMIYDVTARRCGFSRMDDGYYVFVP